MALSGGTLWELNASGGSVQNGGGFNPTNANFMTDLAATSATGNSPVVSSATYTFVAGDVGAWVYVQSGTNWAAGFYQIASVAGGQATLSAAIGQAVQQTSGVQNYIKWKASTVAGCATTASPTGGVFGIDYSQGTSSIINGTDLASTNGTTNPSTCTSAGTPFGPNHVGNIMRVSAGTSFTTGWYEIVSVSGTTATLDRALGSSATLSSGTFRVGGAYPFNSASNDDGFFETGIAGMIYFIKNGSFTMAQAVNTAASGGTQNPILVIGYNSVRGDTPTGSSRPTINTGSLLWTMGQNWEMYNVILTGTSNGPLTTSANCKVMNCKVTCTSTTVSRAGINANGADSLVIACEAVSYRGRAITIGSSAWVYGGYYHDSDIGIFFNTALTAQAQNCIVTSCVSAATRIGGATTLCTINNCTLHGSTNTTGVGLDIQTSSTDTMITNSIITGFATGVAHAQTQSVGFDNYNCYYNNDADVSAAGQWQKGPNDTTVNPTFANVGQITFTNGTTSGSVLTSSGADFSSVVDGHDVLYLVSGTGITAGVYGITSHTSTTLTLDIAPGTDATANKVGQITTGRNFAIGTNLKALGSPGAFPGALTTGYLDIGAAQRQEAGGGSYTFVS